jgi:hypothetical protein
MEIYIILAILLLLLSFIFLLSAKIGKVLAISKRKRQADLQKSLTSNSVPCLSYPISQTLQSSHWLNP